MIDELWEAWAELEQAIVGRFGAEFSDEGSWDSQPKEPSRLFIEMVARCGQSIDGWSRIWKSRAIIHRIAVELDDSQHNDEALLELLKDAEVAA